MRRGKTYAVLDRSRVTERTRRTYDRQSRFYDVGNWLGERLMVGRWRRQQWGLVPGKRVLEVGVGTGSNFPHYPAGAEVTAIDLSPKMLGRAAARARRLGVGVTLALMDAQEMAFPDDSFDAMTSTFVFCSVPDAVAGLREVKRVLKPGGKAIMLEHVRSRNRVLGWLMDRLNGIAVRITGANINRDTVVNVERSGLVVREVRQLLGDVVKLIVAEKVAEATR